MPTYDYQCQECGHPFEVRATIKEKEAGLQPACPQCMGKSTRQAFRSVIVMRGGNGDGATENCCGPMAGLGCC